MADSPSAVVETDLSEIREKGLQQRARQLTRRSDRFVPCASEPAIRHGVAVVAQKERPVLRDRPVAQSGQIPPIIVAEQERVEKYVEARLKADIEFAPRFRLLVFERVAVCLGAVEHAFAPKHPVNHVARARRACDRDPPRAGFHAALVTVRRIRDRLGLFELDARLGQGDRQIGCLQCGEHLERGLALLQAGKPAIVAIKSLLRRVGHTQAPGEPSQLLGGATQIRPTWLRGRRVLPAPDGLGTRSVNQIVIKRAFGLGIFEIDGPSGAFRRPGEHAEPALHPVKNRQAVDLFAAQVAQGRLPICRQIRDRQGNGARIIPTNSVIVAPEESAMPDLFAGGPHGGDQRGAEIQFVQDSLERCEPGQRVMHRVLGGIRRAGRRGQREEGPQIGGFGCRDAMLGTERDERLQRLELIGRHIDNARQLRDADHVGRAQQGANTRGHVRAPLRNVCSTLFAARVIVF